MDNTKDSAKTGTANGSDNRKDSTKTGKKSTKWIYITLIALAVLAGIAAILANTVFATERDAKRTAMAAMNAIFKGNEDDFQKYTVYNYDCVTAFDLEDIMPGEFQNTELANLREMKAEMEEYEISFKATGGTATEYQKGDAEYDEIIKQLTAQRPGVRTDRIEKVAVAKITVEFGEKTDTDQLQTYVYCIDGKWYADLDCEYILGE